MFKPASFLIYTKQREIDLRGSLFSRFISLWLPVRRRRFGGNTLWLCGILSCRLLDTLLFRPLRFECDPFPVPSDLLIHPSLLNKDRIDGLGGGVVDIGGLSGLHDVHLHLVDV